jgi:hypothetical protein
MATTVARLKAVIECPPGKESYLPACPDPNLLKNPTGPDQ